MRARASIAFVLLAAAALPASASGQSAVAIAFGDGGAANERQIPVKVSGVVSVDFQGDRAAGCEQSAECDVSGNETWDPGPTGELDVFGKTKPAGGFLLFDVSPFDRDGRTTARVRRTAPDGSVHTCSDVATERGGGQLGAAAGGLEVALSGSGFQGLGRASLLGTRCPGPVDEDVRGLLPVGRLTAQQLAAGGAVVDLSGERPFAAHGLAGTVRSSVVLTLGRPKKPARSDLPRGLRTKRVKFLAVHYAIERVVGRVSLSFGGLPEPVLCDALDACDLRGTFDISAAASGGRADLVAFASGRLSRRQLLAKLGLVRTRRRVHVAGEGSGTWSGGGTVTAGLTRAGAPACRDSAALPGGGLVLAARGRTLAAEYSAGVDGLRTRCAGPSGPDIGDIGVLATGRAPVAILRRRRFALHLRRGVSFTGQGYRGASTADLTVVLRRGRTSVHSFRVPTGPGNSSSFTSIDEIVTRRAP